MPEPTDSDREVLTSLPRSRPVRRSAKRGERPSAATAASDGVQAPPRRRAAAKPSAAKQAAKQAPKPAAARAAKTTRDSSATAQRPRVAPQRKVPAAGYAAPSTRAEEPTASAGAELVSTTFQAAAELAQIGLTVGRQTLRSMFERLPRP